MKINMTPVEAYRQADNQTAKKGRTESQAEFSLNRASQETITLPGNNSGQADAVTARRAPSLIGSVLSSEEKSALMRHFARFGDSSDDATTYLGNARPQQNPSVGLKVDLRG